MFSREQIERCNARLMHGLSAFLNGTPDAIRVAEVAALVRDFQVSHALAFSLLLAAHIGLDLAGDSEDEALFEHYFPHMLHRLDGEEYRHNAYYARIAIPKTKVGKWELRQQSYQPYEAFVCDDLETMADGRVIPQIGYFDRAFPYPALLENGREWMLVTPNEIETMKPAVERAHGKVLTYGLGLGYYTYMASEKDDVSSVTVVEKDPDVIRLFETLLLPQFAHAAKITIVHDDAFSYAQGEMAQAHFDFVFTDLWHDPSDGVQLYLRMKGYESLSPGTTFMYWIEKTLLHYL